MTGEVHQRATEVPRLNTDRPTPARMYDYLLGGKDNYEADRVASEEAIAAAPEVRTIARENRAFLRRAVRMLTESGVDQFIDLGSGLPTQGNVHEVAQRINPTARVVYVDHDPIVLAHGRALLAENEYTVVVTADIREPEKLLVEPDLTSLIDLDRPVALLCTLVTHFIPDEEDPGGILARYRDAVAPGSYLVLSQSTHESKPDRAGQVAQSFRNATAQLVPRSYAEVSAYFSGFRLMDPGIVYVVEWRPDDDRRAETAEDIWVLAGVGRKPG